MQTSAFTKHARCPKRPAKVKPFVPSLGVVDIAPFAFGPVMPAERIALDQIIETADVIDTPAGEYLLVPADAALIETLAQYGAAADDREDEADSEPEPEDAGRPGNVLLAHKFDPTDADFEPGEDHEPSGDENDTSSITKADVAAARDRRAPRPRRVLTVQRQSYADGSPTGEVTTHQVVLQPAK